MNIMSYTAARSHLAKTMEKVCEDHSAVIITRSNAKPVVMISLEDYESLKETNYLLKSSKNASRLKESTDEVEKMILTKKKSKTKKEK